MVIIYLIKKFSFFNHAAYPQIEQTSNLLLLGFAPNKVYHTLTVTGQVVGSYPAFSPLSQLKEKTLGYDGIFSVALSVSCGIVIPHEPGSYPVFCSTEPGLSSAAMGNSDDHARPCF